MESVLLFIELDGSLPVEHDGVRRFNGRDSDCEAERLSPGDGGRGRGACLGGGGVSSRGGGRCWGGWGVQAKVCVAEGPAPGVYRRGSTAEMVVVVVS